MRMTRTISARLCCDMGNGHTWLKRLLNDGNLFLWRTAPAALWSQQLFDHAYLPTSLMTSFKTSH